MAANSDDADEAEDELLNPSELGTKEYWDDTYSRELINHEADPDDEGTIWFSESNAEEVVQKELRKLEELELLRRSTKTDQNHNGLLMASRFLDLGTGNGHMLFTLRAEDEECADETGWRGEMVGVDYSLASVQLARRIVARMTDGGVITVPPRFEQWNILTDPPDLSWLKDGFDVVLDKGTFDAISLMQCEDASHPCKSYRSKVTPLIKPGGFLFVTSCNWTKDELINWLAPPTGNELQFWNEAAYPTFTFGGRKGQSVVTVTFRRSTEIDDK